MSMTYAIADLHGRFDLLEMALVKIVDHAEPAAILVANAALQSVSVSPLPGLYISLVIQCVTDR
jgi:hypothetical protein